MIKQKYIRYKECNNDLKTTQTPSEESNKSVARIIDVLFNSINREKDDRSPGEGRMHMKPPL